jgi:hypothetical protein
MPLAGVLCLCVGFLCAAAGVRSLMRPADADPISQAARALGPTQLAAALMLAAGGVGALASGPQTGLMLVVVCILGAVGTVAAGSLQGARYVARTQAALATPRSCAGGCGSCTLSCAD